MIPKYMKNNFDSFVGAVKNGHVALLETKDKLGNDQYLLVVHRHLPVADENGNTEEMLPFARMFKYTKEDDPFEMYEPPK